MKWLWSLGVLIIYFAYYVFCWMAFATNFDILAWPMVIGGGIGILLMTKAFLNEYFIS